MTEIYAHRITTHAVERFSERIRPLPADDAAAKEEMLCCLRAANPNRLKKIDRKGRRTLIVPTGCCYFVFSKGNMVTVLKEVDPERGRAHGLR